MPFDYKSAKADGWSDPEIRDFLLNQQGAKEAIAHGYGEGDVLSHYGFSPDFGQISEAARAGSIVATGIAEGAFGSVGAPGSLLQWEWNKVPADSPLKTSPFLNWMDPSGLPNIQQGVETADRLLSDIGVPHLTPSGVGEKLLSGVAHGVGGMAILPSTGSYIGQLAAGVTGGLSAEAAHQLMPNSRLAPIAAGMIGGGAAGIGETWIDNVLLGREAAATAQQAAEAGLNVDSLKAASAKLGDVIARHTRSSQEMLDKAEQGFKAETQRATSVMQGKIAPLQTMAQGTAANVGTKVASSSTLQEAGSQFQNSARSWLTKDFPAAQEAAGQEFFGLVPPETPAEVGNLAAASHQIIGELGPLTKAGQTLAPSKVPQFLKDIEGYEKGLEEGLVPQATLGNLKSLRTKIGEAISDPTIAPGVTRQQLDHLYAAATNDMKSVAAEQGPEALQAFNNYNEAHTALFNIRDDVMSQILKSTKEGQEGISPEDVAKRLLTSGKTGGTLLAKMRAVLPDATDHLAAVALKTDRWGSLSPEARQALLPDPAIRQPVDAAYAAKSAGIDVAKAEQKSAIDLATNAKQELRWKLRAQARQLGEQKTQLGEQIRAAEQTAGTAKETAKTAQEAYDNRPTSPGVNELMRHVTGMGLHMGGSAVYGDLAGQALGLGPQGAAALGVATGLAPVAARLLTPAVRREAVMGGVAGNSLALPSNQQQ